MILTIRPGEEPGQFAPVSVPDLREAVAIIGCAVADVRYRDTQEKPARVLLFCRQVMPGTYNDAATRYIESEGVKVYGVALIADSRDAAPLVDAIRRRSRPHCAADGCTSFADGRGLFCRVHSDTSEEAARRKVHNLGMAILTFAAGCACGYARHAAVPTAVALFWVGVLGFALGLRAGKRKPADKLDKMPAPDRGQPVEESQKVSQNTQNTPALPARRIVSRRPR